MTESRSRPKPNPPLDSRRHPKSAVARGTGVQHTMLGTADNIYWEQSGNLPAQPPAKRIADPTPKSATNVAFVNDERWTKCGDPAAPGIKPIMDYLKSLPWRPDLTASNCDPDRYYVVNNTRPAYLSNGDINTAGITAGTVAPPSTVRTIGDALNEKNIDWAFFGGGYNAAARFDSGSTNPIDVMIGTGGDWYCDLQSVPICEVDYGRFRAAQGAHQGRDRLLRRSRSRPTARGLLCQTGQL
jgi:hypothetical protein